MTGHDTNRRELKRELTALADAADVDGDGSERCADCGGALPGYDAGEHVTAPFATYECTCDRDLSFPGTATLLRGEP